MVIQIKNFIDSDPAILMDNIEKNLEKNKKIVLDFGNLENVTHDFLEKSLGNVLRNYTFEAIQFKINFINCPDIACMSKTPPLQFKPDMQVLN